MSDSEATPPGHVVIGLRIEANLLPAWFEQVTRVAGPLARRMAVVEKPDEWVVQIELPEENVGPLYEQLNEAWNAFDPVEE